MGPRSTLYSAMIWRRAFAACPLMSSAANTWTCASWANSSPNSAHEPDAQSADAPIHRCALPRSRRHPHEQRQHDEGGDAARTPVAHQRQRHPGERDQPRHARHDRERLQRDDRGDAGRQQLAERIDALHRHAQPTSDPHQVQQQQRDRADHAQFLAERREDEVAAHVRDQRGRTLADAGAHDAAGGQREPSLRQLEVALARDHCGVERVDPVVDAGLHVVERQVPQPRARPRTGRSPARGSPARPLAIHSITTKTPKNSSDAPRSRSRNSTASEATHATSSGPRSLARGSPNRPTPAREQLALVREVGRPGR